MLKTRIVKAGFFGHGALFLMVAPVSVHQMADSRFFVPSSPSAVLVIDAHDSSKTVADTTAVYPSIKLNASASQYAQKFIKQNREDLEAIEQKSDRYFAIIERVFRQHDLPAELKYLAVVESELNAKAISHVGARGPWQLMPQTARELGLKVGGGVDERTHYYKSTVAAAKYLKALYAQYGDWLLVIAAYNSGSGVVDKAIRRSGTRNFWYLQRFLPKETSLHVKRFIGTHCFFQVEHSLTQLTKAEAQRFYKQVAAAKVQQSLSHSPDSIFAVR